MVAKARKAYQPLALASLLVILAVSGPNAAGSPVRQTFDETRFWTGCEPGPASPPPAPEHRQSPPSHAELARSASLQVDLDSADRARPIIGTGFNIEHALWSCPEFRGLFEQELLDPFQPAVVRVDTGMLPAAPPDVPAPQLVPWVYSSVLSSAPYQASWSFLRRLNRAGVRLILGVWGGPPQFTFEDDRLGTLDPKHYDDYVDYVSTVVEFLRNQQRIQIWATTIANEPDGGDGNQIPPDGLAYIGHRLAERLAPLGVRLYGPDVSSSAAALQYLPALLDDPEVARSLAFVGFHEYQATEDVRQVVDYVHARDASLPVVVTEFTSFAFGDMDSGQETSDGIGFMLDVTNTLASHYREGADAALYWDAVDYLQPGHAAITRWGVLRGPQRDFARRRRYYGLLQIMQYLRPGSRILDARWQGDSDGAGYLAIQTPSGAPAVILVNQPSSDLSVDVSFMGSRTTAVKALGVWRTDADHRAERLGRVQLGNGTASLILPPRSVTTLFPTGSPIEASGAE